MSFVDPEGKAATEVIRQRVTLAVMRELVAPYAKLNRSQRGPCPFHGGKDPNFSIFVKGGAAGYHCFVCGASGDVYRFLMEMTGASFPTVRTQLADRVGVVLPPPRPMRRSADVARAEGLGPALRALTETYCRTPLPTNAPAWQHAGVASRLIGYVPLGDHTAVEEASAVAGAADLIAASVCDASGADPRAGGAVIILREKDGTPVGCVGVTTEGAVRPETLVTLSNEPTLVGWGAARAEAMRLGWVVLAPEVASALSLTVMGAPLKLPVVTSLAPLSADGWTDADAHAMLAAAGVHEVVVVTEGLSPTALRWAYATAAVLPATGLRLRFIDALPEAPEPGEAAPLVRHRLEAWARAAEDAYASRVALLRQSAAYATGGWTAVLPKLASTLQAVRQGPDPLVAMAYLLWTVRALHIGSVAQLTAALDSGRA